jgi:putative ABC transport system substrate-binding protein
MEGMNVSALLLWSALGWAGDTIAVLRSDDLPAYQMPVDRYVAELEGQNVEVFDLLGDRQRALRIAAQLRADPPPLVLALGPKAAWIAVNELPDVPLVYAMVFAPQRYGIIDGVTGVSMDVPPELVLAQLDLMFPDLKRLGVLLGAESNPTWLPAVVAAAELAGFSLQIRRITTDQRIRQTLGQLRPEIDALWLMPEPSLLTPTGYHTLYTEALRTNLPILAYSESLVRAGALMCLAPDYDDVGRLAAHLSQQILAGTDPDRISTVPPEAFRVVLNEDTKEALQLDLDPILLDFVDEVVTAPPRR